MTALRSVCVVGAGAIGSLCAGHLGQVVPTSVLVRRRDHVRVLQQRGLRVSGKSELQTPLTAATTPTELPPADLVVVATKAAQVPDAAAQLVGHFPDAVVLTIQNGLGSEEVVQAHGPWPIVSSVTFMSGTREDDAHVHYELDTATWIGPYAGTGTPVATARAVGDLFAASGLAVEVFPDLRPAQWSKLIFNAAVNSVAALTDLPHVALYARRERDTDLGHLVHDLVEEGKAVARAAGVELLEDPWEMNRQAVAVGATAGGDYAHVPSMLADVREGHRTEVDFIVGAVVREAQRHGVPVPRHRALYRLVKARDGSYDDPPPELAATGGRVHAPPEATAPSQATEAGG